MIKSRKFIALLLALALAFSMLAGCGDSNKPSTDPTPGQSSTGGSDTGPGDTGSGSANEGRALNLAISGDTGTLYPNAASGGFVSLMYAFYEVLWDYTAEGEKQMILATDWEQISDIQYKLTIREGVKFSNGNPLTAEDVMFSMDVCKDDPRFYLNVKAIDFDKTCVTGEYTMDVWYTEYDCTQDVSFSQLMILDKESFDLEALSMNPIGTGPYVVEDYVVNSHVICKANETYWGEQPNIDTITFKVINESAQIVNALETGDIDLATSIPVDDAEYVRSLGYDVTSSYGGYAHTALYSLDPSSPLASKDARWAVSYAIDRESIAELLYKGLSSVPRFPTSEHTVDFEERFAGMSDIYATGYSVEKAKEYAEKAGLTGKTLRIITNGTGDYNTMAEMIQENLNSIGIDSTITSYDSATYFSIVMDESNFDIALFYLSCQSMMAVDVMKNYIDFIPLGWHDELRDQYGALPTEAVPSADAQTRNELLYEGLKIFTDVDPWYAICEAITPRATSSELGGVEYMLAGTLHYNDIYWK